MRKETKAQREALVQGHRAGPGHSPKAVGAKPMTEPRSALQGATSLEAPGGSCGPPRAGVPCLGWADSLPPAPPHCIAQVPLPAESGVGWGGGGAAAQSCPDCQGLKTSRHRALEPAELGGLPAPTAMGSPGIGF